MLKFIDSIPLPVLIGIAILLGILPLNSTPHLVEKLTMLMHGELAKPINIFDLFMHGAPIVILVISMFRRIRKMSD